METLSNFSSIYCFITFVMGAVFMLAMLSVVAMGKVKESRNKVRFYVKADIYTDDASNYTEWSDDGGWSDTNDIDLVEKAFIEGAKWADNNICLSSIWNDTSIMPSDNKGIIYLTKNNKLGVLNSIKSNNWDWYVSDKYSIIKWAYIDDLLP